MEKKEIIDDASKKGKREKIKDTKIYSRKWGSEGIMGDCPGPTRAKTVVC